MNYIDCGKYAQEVLDDVKSIPNKGKLVIITVGDDPASKVYVRGKIRDCEYCNIPVEHIRIDDSPKADLALLSTIHYNNLDTDVAGIIVQLPLPAHMGSSERFCRAIDPTKDVDGLGSDEYFKPCTPKGIMYILEREIGKERLSGMDAVIIGRSELVGKPLAKMLLNSDCTVTLAHSKSAYDSLREHMRRANIVVSAVGQAKAFNLTDCNVADIVIDVGINRDENGKLCGDFTGFAEDCQSTTKVTPVPKGIGLMTRAMLMKNIAESSALLKGSVNG